MDGAAGRTAEAQSRFDAKRAALAEAFAATRARTRTLAAPLSEEDQSAQSMPDASPVKWHLGHTTWFWEQFVLGPNLSGFEPHDPRFAYLFNSYYEAVGERQPRPQRGLITRPSLEEVVVWRDATDEAMARLFATAPEAAFARIAPLIELGLAHEEQHQELILMDVKHLFSLNPLHPAAYPAPERRGASSGPRGWTTYGGGLAETGWDGSGFSFDNETPRHKHYLRPFALADRPVTNAEYAAFVEDGGYRTAALWLSDGWAWVNAGARTAPAYWTGRDGEWLRFTLHGLAPLEPEAPVCHLSFFEAAAFAEWARARLPTEAEWETAAGGADPHAGDFMQPGVSADPAPAGGTGMRGLFGHVWEWTASAYSPYPGFRPAAGAVGEYNGKFMSGQMVLRGGCCATVRGHMRATYRNFFYPHQTWMFAGLRLARDV